jgi:hypothetical protein
MELAQYRDESRSLVLTLSILWILMQINQLNTRTSTNAHNQIWSNTKMKKNGNFLQQHKWTKFSWINLRQMLL